MEKQHRGTTHLDLSPTELVEKLVPLIPPARQNRVRYPTGGASLRCAATEFSRQSHKYGLSLCSRPRKPNAPRPVTASTVLTQRRLVQPGLRTDPRGLPLAGVFSIDVLACPRCSARMQHDDSR
jgi:hypothetical protein